MDFFDLHCDTLYECFQTNQSLQQNHLAVSLEQASCFQKHVQTFAIWIPDEMEQPFKFYQQVLAFSKKQFQIHQNNIRLATKWNELAWHLHSALLAVEGGRVLEGNLDHLQQLYNDGVKMLTLTWNGENELAYGAGCEQGGLKPFGREVVQKMNQLKMVCDLSHLNRESYYEAISLCKYPAASHSCFYQTNPHRRNLTDEQFLLLCKKGGIMGLCLYPEFLGNGNVFEKVYEHICHGLFLGGENALAIGSDFDGADMDTELDSIAKTPKLYRYLANRGIHNAVLQKIFYKNALKFYMKVLTKDVPCGIL